jgi:predicted ester cyclase
MGTVREQCERLVGALNRGEGLAGLLAERTGPEFSLRVQSWTKAFPDLQVRLQQVVIAGDWATMRLRWEGTHRGEWLGAPGTGRRVSVNGIALTRWEKGRLAEVWLCEDRLGVLQQVGVIPDPL